MVRVLRAPKLLEGGKANCMANGDKVTSRYANDLGGSSTRIKSTSICAFTKHLHSSGHQAALKEKPGSSINQPLGPAHPSRSVEWSLFYAVRDRRRGLLHHIPVGSLKLLEKSAKICWMKSWDDTENLCSFLFFSVVCIFHVIGTLYVVP